jgi:hypothetical protein
MNELSKSNSFVLTPEVVGRLSNFLSNNQQDYVSFYLILFETIYLSKLTSLIEQKLSILLFPFFAFNFDFIKILPLFTLSYQEGASFCCLPNGTGHKSVQK